MGTKEVLSSISSRLRKRTENSRRHCERSGRGYKQLVCRFKWLRKLFSHSSLKQRDSLGVAELNRSEAAARE